MWPGRPWSYGQFMTEICLLRGGESPTGSSPLQAVSKLAATDVPQAGSMAPLTSDEIRRRRGADVDADTGSHVRGPKRDGERPVRHLVIFAAPVVGFAGPGWGSAAPVPLAGG
jgi:hypothetical protein